jgi:hypothetical protein
MRFALLALLFATLFGCKAKTSDNELYELIYVCFDEFYENKKISVQKELTAFELHLIQEGHLKTNEFGSDFRELFDYLSNNTYFKTPLTKDDFNQSLLYENPNNLVECLNYSYNIDSLELMQLSYYQATSKISEQIETTGEVDIHDMFTIYAKHISLEDYNAPFVRESLLLLLYRWYYKSKYDREIQINLDELSNEEITD